MPGRRCLRGTAPRQPCRRPVTNVVTAVTTGPDHLRAFTQTGEVPKVGAGSSAGRRIGSLRLRRGVRTPDRDLSRRPPTRHPGEQAGGGQGPAPAACLHLAQGGHLGGRHSGRRGARRVRYPAWQPNGWPSRTSCGSPSPAPPRRVRRGFTQAADRSTSPRGGGHLGQHQTSSYRSPRHTSPSTSPRRGTAGCR